MKTLEFKFDLTQEQITKIENWRSRLNQVWNKGLSLLEESQQQRWRKKLDWAEYSPERWYYHVNGSEFALACRLTYYDRKHEAAYQCCELRKYTDLDVDKLFNSGSYYNADNMPDLADIPSKFKTSVHKSLIEAWKRYQDAKSRSCKPKYKKRFEKVNSLANFNAGGQSLELKPSRIEGSDHGLVNFPKLGRLRVISLYKRFNPDLGYGVCRIVCEPSGYYLHILTKEESKPYKDSLKPVGVDPGVTSVVALDNGRQYKPANPGKDAQKVKRRLQRKLSRQKLKSKNWEKTQKRLAQIDEKTRRSRKAFNHQLSTKIVREYGAVALEDTALVNMTRKPKAKLKEDGKGYAPNGAKAKAGLNKALADVAIGQLRAMIEQKAGQAENRYTERTKAPYSSQTCHRCHERGDRKGKHFKCLNQACSEHGKKQDADTNAARNHLLNSSLLEAMQKPAWFCG